MKNLTNITLTGLLLIGMIMLAPATLLAQTCEGGGKNFVDLDGDGFNDNAPDADGDGIPNGLDDDYERPLDGDGEQKGKLGETEPAKAQTKTMAKTQKFNRLKAANGSTYQYHTGDGTGSGNVDDNTTQAGTGDCDGTGPKGNQHKGGGK